MSGEESTIRWRDDWVAFLIKCRQKHNHLFTGKKFTANNGWAIIKREMVNAGLPREVSLSQVRKKWCNLTTKYKDLKHRYDTQESDFNPHHWKFYDIIENVLSTQTKQQIIKATRSSSKDDSKLKIEKKQSSTNNESKSSSTITTRSMNAAAVSEPAEKETTSLQYSLNWNNYHNNLSGGLNDLLGNGDMVDVTLACDGKLIYAHKIVLSICSPFFKEMFKGNPCKHPIVFLKDISHDVMQGLIEFMYSGQVTVKQNDLNKILETAEALQIKGLTGQRKNLNNKLPSFENSSNNEDHSDDEDSDVMDTEEPSTSSSKKDNSCNNTEINKKRTQDPLDDALDVDDMNLYHCKKDGDVSYKIEVEEHSRPKRKRTKQNANDSLSAIEFIKEPTIQMMVENDDYDFNSLVGITDPGGQNQNSALLGIDKFDTSGELVE